MAGSLREALEKAQNEQAEPEVSAEPEIVNETITETGNDDTSTDVENVESLDTPPETDKPTEATGTETDKPADAAVSDAPTPYDNAPASWKGDAKEVWAALPEKARREVIRRERQIESTLRETAQSRQVADEFIGTANQYEERLRDWGTSPVGAFKAFMDADRNLSSGPMSSRAAALANIIKEYNIDIGALDSALAGVDPDPLLDVDARVQALVQQQLAPFHERVNQEQQNKNRQLTQAIDEMANSPEFPYFEDVREEMADLIEINMRRGVVVNLADAYKKIVGYSGKANPQQTIDTVRKARAASLSVSGSPAASTAAGNPADLRGTILAALEK